MFEQWHWLRKATRPLTAAALAAALNAGQVQAHGIRPATVPEDLGAATHRIFQAQVDKAGQDAFVIYENEWRGNTTELGPSGRFHLVRMMRRLQQTTYPVVIQIHPDDAVNQARRNFVVNTLLQAGIGDAENRVVVGPPAAEGLYGEEAVMLYPLFLTSRFWGTMGGGWGGMGMMGGGFGGMGRWGGMGMMGGWGGGWGGGFGGWGGGFGGWGGGWGGGGYGGTYRGLGY